MNPLLALLMAAFFTEVGVRRRPKSKGPTMFRYFNALQMVALFSGMPYLIGWLNEQAGVVWYGLIPAVIVYIVLFVMLIISTAQTILSVD